MSNTPFDQEAYEAPDTMPRTSDGRPDVAGVVAKRRREATLYMHINRTVAAALKVLAGQGQSTTARDEALAILLKAAPKYTRLGGPSQYWTADGRWTGKGK